MKKKNVVPAPEPEKQVKNGAAEIRRAYFKDWYESCKDIYNSERRKKRKEKKKAGKPNGQRI